MTHKRPLSLSEIKVGDKVEMRLNGSSYKGRILATDLRIVRGTIVVIAFESRDATTETVYTIRFNADGTYREATDYKLYRPTKTQYRNVYLDGTVSIFTDTREEADRLATGTHRKRIALITAELPNEYAERTNAKIKNL